MCTTLDIFLNTPEGICADLNLQFFSSCLDGHFKVEVQESTVDLTRVKIISPHRIYPNKFSMEKAIRSLAPADAFPGKTLGTTDTQLAMNL